MKVATLSGNAFEEHARVLAHVIQENCTSGFDLFVGIRRGGAFVADALMKYLPENYCTLRRDVTLQRVSTKRKTGFVEKILHRLPYPVLDWMRILESRFLSAGKEVVEPRLWMPSEKDRLPENDKVGKILVVDDAIDSGATLAGVVEGLKKIYPDSEIKTAVMTVTTSSPLILPDWTVYKTGVLLRFPWSADYKGDDFRVIGADRTLHD